LNAAPAAVKPTSDGWSIYRRLIKYARPHAGMFSIGVIGAILVTSLTLSGSGYVQSIPVGTLLVLLVVAGVAGLLAAQLPARRAARLDVLGALRVLGVCHQASISRGCGFCATCGCSGPA